MSTCKHTQALLFEHLEGRIDPTSRAQLDAHVATCAHCRQVFATWSTALPRLRDLPFEAPSEVQLRRTENQVLQALQSVPPPRRRVSMWLAVAASVAVLAGAGVLYLRARAPQPFARIQSLWGRVTLSGVALTSDAVMGAGGVLDIATEGEASFVVGRAAEVRLFGPGRVALDGTRARPRLRLDGGRLAVHIAHRQADEGFSVATRHGRVEVRGTHFVVGYSGQGSYVHVEEGEVAAFRAGEAAATPVKAGQTFSFVVEQPSAEPPPARSEVAPAPADCPALNCAELGLRARRAMRTGSPTRALDIVDEALGRSAACQPDARCLDELGYLRAESLRQAGRIEAAVAAYRMLNRPGATRAMRQNALYAQAQLERRLGRAAEALQSLQRAYAVHPEGALAEESLAALLDGLDPKSGEARNTARRYLDRYPRGVAAARARRILSDTPRSR
jgi:ferric-dicitrate binding protein FerR (iron transport regulator)